MAKLTQEQIETRNKCLEDFKRLVNGCINDTPSEDGKTALRCLGFALEGIGTDGLGE
jgi:hypothetical protein